jgi:hypothetical protein
MRRLIRGGMMFLLALASPAPAGGSLPLPEVMDVVKDSRALMQDIRDALGRENLKPDDITCAGDRFGSQWKYLGGSRTLPFTCRIGKRDIVIAGDAELLDSKNNVIKGGVGSKSAFSRAHAVRVKNLTWKWEQAQ